MQIILVAFFIEWVFFVSALLSYLLTTCSLQQMNQTKAKYDPEKHSASDILCGHVFMPEEVVEIYFDIVHVKVQKSDQTGD